MSGSPYHPISQYVIFSYPSSQLIKDQATSIAISIRSPFLQFSDSWNHLNRLIGLHHAHCQVLVATIDQDLQVVLVEVGQYLVAAFWISLVLLSNSIATSFPSDLRINMQSLLNVILVQLVVKWPKIEAWSIVVSLLAHLQPRSVRESGGMGSLQFLRR